MLRTGAVPPPPRRGRPRPRRRRARSGAGSWWTSRSWTTTRRTRRRSTASRCSASSAPSGPSTTTIASAAGWTWSSRRSARPTAGASRCSGICFGAQALCVAMGGQVVPRAVDGARMGRARRARPATGVPEGPWFQFHARPVPATRVGARSSRATTCACRPSAMGRHLGVQFHPELDARQLSRWFAAGADRVADGRGRRAGRAAGDDRGAGGVRGRSGGPARRGVLGPGGLTASRGGLQQWRTWRRSRFASLRRSYGDLPPSTA